MTSAWSWSEIIPWHGNIPPSQCFKSNFSNRQMLEAYPEHYGAALLTSVQPSTSWLGSSTQICPFLPNPTTGLLILHLLPASGWSHIHIITMSGGLAALGTGSKEEQGPAKSVMRWFYPSVDHPSATDSMWNNPCLVLTAEVALSWGDLQHRAAFQKYCSPSTLQHLSPITARASPEPCCYGSMKGISQRCHHPRDAFAHFSISEVWVFEMNQEAWQFVFYHKSPQDQHHGKWGRILVLRVAAGI